MQESNDLRLTNHRYLNERVFTRKKYQSANIDNDHDHCEFCFTKFMQGNIQNTLQEGYTTSDGYYWICSSCYDDFKDIFKWKLKKFNQLDCGDR